MIANPQEREAEDIYVSWNHLWLYLQGDFETSESIRRSGGGEREREPCSWRAGSRAGKLKSAEELCLAWEYLGVSFPLTPLLLGRDRQHSVQPWQEWHVAPILEQLTNVSTYLYRGLGWKRPTELKETAIFTVLEVSLDTGRHCSLIKRVKAYLITLLSHSLPSLSSSFLPPLSCTPSCPSFPSPCPSVNCSY